MKLRYVLLLLLLLPVVAAASVTVPYGSSKSLSLELNRGQTELLTVTVDGVDANASYITVSYRSGAVDRVFCAPSPLKDIGTSADFTCVVVPGDPFEGSVVFTAFDKNDVPLKDSRLDLDVRYKDVWFEGRAIAKVGSTIRVASHVVVVKRASFLYALLSVDGNPVTAFINDDTKLADDLYVVFRGYDPDTREVFFVFRSTVPVAASVEEKQYYVVAPKVVYATEDNTYEIPVITDCSKVEYRVKGSDVWVDRSLEDNYLTVETNEDRIYVRCYDDHAQSTVVYLRRAKVIEKNVELNIPRVCALHGYVERSKCELTPEKKSEICSVWASANGYQRIPPGYKLCRESHYSGIIVLLIVLAILGVLYWLRKSGRLNFGKPKTDDIEKVQESAVEDATGVVG